MSEFLIKLGQPRYENTPRPNATLLVEQGFETGVADQWFHVPTSMHVFHTRQ